ncbi:MAG: TlpA family protein disulfide reductase [Gemmatimonas sp.]|jgi:peroxiredoxin|uniref:TlpA family protein disulfide reductase n=1 Tax=Gemmatimonas sp. TaxID=1962908 RepID=UPI0031CB946B|nr:TlpA family protein disulfide reductase [Gemmatimonas sp.]
MTRLLQHARVAVAAIALTAAPALAQDLGIAVGEKAPGGPLETLTGQTVDLGSFLGKQPTVVEFWATWCSNCKQLEPSVRAAHAKYGATVRFVTVAVSVNQSAERVKAWQAANKLPGELLYDRKGTVSGAYDVPATSYVVVVDKTGKIVYTGVGGTQNLDAAIKKAM